MNTELFTRIHNTIEPEPDLLEMGGWEYWRTACGSTRCAAGWAIHLTTGKPLYDGTGQIHLSVVDLAERLDVPVDFEVIGAKLLDLDPDVAADLFYTSNSVAAQFIHLAAAGREAEAIDALAEFR